MRISDWSSDVCSSDLFERRAEAGFGALSRVGGQTFELVDGLTGDGCLDGPAARWHCAVLAGPVECIHRLALFAVVRQLVLRHFVVFHAATTVRQTKAIENRPLSGTKHSTRWPAFSCPDCSKPSSSR